MVFNFLCIKYYIANQSIIKLGKISPHIQTNPPNPAPVYSVPLSNPALVLVSIDYRILNTILIYLSVHLSTLTKYQYKTITKHVLIKAGWLQTIWPLYFPLTYQTSAWTMHSTKWERDRNSRIHINTSTKFKGLCTITCYEVKGNQYLFKLWS